MALSASSLATPAYDAAALAAACAVGTSPLFAAAFAVLAAADAALAALAAVAQFRGAIWGLLLFTADSLADIDNYDQRDWGSEAFDKALELCLDIIVQM